jgi:hypothetical protein
MVPTTSSPPRTSSRRRRILRILAPAALSLALIAGAYSQIVLPWASRWGARQIELDTILPGDHLVRHPKMDSTRAITIHRPPAEVFPWLLQIGQARGGFYSYEWLENLAGCQIHNANRIVPEWQNLKAGDPVGLHPKLPDAFRVEDLRANRYILLRGGPAGQAAAYSWLFYLFDGEANSTRLVVRSRGDYPPSFANFFIYRAITEPLQFVMERGMLLGIRDRVEKRVPLKESS